MNTGGNKSFFKHFVSGVFVVFVVVAIYFLLVRCNGEELHNRSFLDIQGRIEMLSKLKAGKQPVRFEEGGNEIEVIIGTSRVGRYLWGDRLPKPILYDVKTFGGDRITRSLPFQKIKGETKDHPHHTGIVFTYASVNGENFETVAG